MQVEVESTTSTNAGQQTSAMLTDGGESNGDSDVYSPIHGLFISSHSKPQPLCKETTPKQVCACRGQGAQCDTDAEFDVDVGNFSVTDQQLPEQTTPFGQD